MFGIGSTVGNYVIRSVLGEGGMGIVYLAEHPLIGRRVAVKVIHPSYAKNPDAVSRFFTEAQAVNRIGHPNIVDITDYGQTTEGECYFVMEYLAGQSLGARVKQGPLPVRDAVYVMVQAADALAASHANGILHRDLKPDNVFLVTRGSDKQFVKVLDFGLAKLTGGEERVSHKTRTGSVMGTPLYMAPEQCYGKGDIDGRCDVYSLGVILFEMLTGRVPFTGEGYGEIIVKHMTDPPPRVRDLAPDCPEWLDATVDRLLAKKREARIQTMAELRDLFAQALAGAAPSLPAPIGFAPTLPPTATGVDASRGPGYSTTLALGAGETVAERTAARSRKRLVAVLGGLAVVGVAGALLLARGAGPGATGGEAMQAAVGTPADSVAAATPAAATPAAAALAPTGAASPAADTNAPTAPVPVVPGTTGVAAAPRPTEVTIRLDSEPTGATVTRADGTVIGTTPHDWTLPRSDKPVTVRFVKDGFQPRAREVVPRTATTVLVELTPRRPPRATRPSRRRSASPAPEKPAERPRPASAFGDDDLLPPESGP